MSDYKADLDDADINDTQEHFIIKRVGEDDEEGYKILVDGNVMSLKRGSDEYKNIISDISRDVVANMRASSPVFDVLKTYFPTTEKMDEHKIARGLTELLEGIYAIRKSISESIPGLEDITLADLATTITTLMGENNV